MPWKPVADGDSDGLLITKIDPAGLASEDYRTLRANLLYAFVESPPRVIVTTSPDRHEGKTSVCANLGVVLSQVNNTLIVDCDLRKPAMHKVFEVRNTYGLTDILIGERNLRDICHKPMSGLTVLTAGHLTPNPAELLSSTRFADFIESVRSEFDYVLIDTPPVGLVSDAAIVARRSDGVLLILDAQSTRKGSVRQSIRGLEGVEARVLGTVMNRVKVPKQASRNMY